MNCKVSNSYHKPYIIQILSIPDIKLFTVYFYENNVIKYKDITFEELKSFVEKNNMIYKPNQYGWGKYFPKAGQKIYI